MSSTAEKQVAIHAERMPSAPVTPAHMLQMAVEQGADLDKLEKLMDLQQRWEETEARKAFVSALNGFKENPPRLSKNKHVQFDTSKGRTEYHHATLDHVSSTIGEGLSKHGISHRWNTEQLDGGLIRVTCILTHAQGHSERTALQAVSDQSGGKNGIQAIGSTVTYLQRYTLLAATGMAVADQDDDAQSAAGAAPQYITDSQVDDLLKAAVAAGVDEEYICTKAKTESIGEIPASRFAAAFNHLSGLAKKNGGAK